MNHFQVSVFAAALFSALLASNPLNIRAADEPTARSKAQVDPKAEEILRRMTDAIKEARNIRLEMQITTKMQIPGLKQDMPTEYSFVAERPNKLAMRIKGQAMGVNIVSDGQKLYVHLPMRNIYRITNAPASIADVRASAGAPSGPHDMLIGGLFSADPYGNMLKDADKISYVGITKEAGQELHQLKIVQPDMKWDMFISAGTNPILTKMTSDMSKTLAADLPAEARKNASMIITVNYNNWDLAAKTTAEDFKFTPPTNARKVESFSRPRPRQKTNE